MQVATGHRFHMAAKRLEIPLPNNKQTVKRVRCVTSGVTGCWRRASHTVQISVLDARIWRAGIAALTATILGAGLQQVGTHLWQAHKASGAIQIRGKDPNPIDYKALPLRTKGRWLVDKQGKHVRLRCVNWYGAHLESQVVGGLDRQPLDYLASKIINFGFNCVRLPYSLEMQLKSTQPSQQTLRANPALWNATSLEVLDATVKALTSRRILVILNNHQSKAMWCCSEWDGEGLWYTPEFPEQVWIQSLASLADRYKHDPFVVGFDLRNEPRGVSSPMVNDGRGLHIRRMEVKRAEWGTGKNDTDWAAAAVKGALAVSARNPAALIIVEGIDYAKDLSGIRRDARLHTHPKLVGRVMYEAHEYCWYHEDYILALTLHWGCVCSAVFLTCDAWYRGCGTVKYTFDQVCRYSMLIITLLLLWSWSLWLTSYSRFVTTLHDRWGFLLEEDTAPVWLGEFGSNGPLVTDNWFFEVGEVTWWYYITRYISEHHIDYAYWALNGDKSGSDETFGLLKEDYKTVRHPWILESLP